MPEQSRVDHRFFPLRRGEAPLVIASLAGLIAASGIAISSGGYEFLFYIAVVAVLMLVVTCVHRRYPLTRSSLWALFAWTVLHMAGGMWPLPAPTGVLYNFWLVPDVLKYDQLIHAYGFGVTAWVCWQVLIRWSGVDTRTAVGWVPLTAAALGAMGLGAFNEVIEFTATKLVEKTNVGDYGNNAWDLVFNMCGAVISVGLIRIKAKQIGEVGERAPAPR